MGLYLFHKYCLLLSVGSLVVLTFPNYRIVHVFREIAPGSDKRYLPHKIRALYFTKTSAYIICTTISVVAVTVQTVCASSSSDIDIKHIYGIRGQTWMLAVAQKMIYRPYNTVYS